MRTVIKGISKWTNPPLLSRGHKKPSTFFKIKEVSNLKDYDGMNYYAAKAMGYKPIPKKNEILIDRKSINKKETIKHELIEYELMRNGTSYWPAHCKALQLEKDNSKNKFKLQTTVPVVDYARSYGYKRKLDYMTPDEYIEKSMVSHNIPVNPRTKDDYERSSIHPNNVKRIKMGLITPQKQVPALWLETKEGKLVGQEGRHRAIAARELGIEKVPVWTVESDKTFLKKKEGYNPNKGYWEKVEEEENAAQGMHSLFNDESKNKWNAWDTDVVYMNPMDYYKRTRSYQDEPVGGTIFNDESQNDMSQSEVFFTNTRPAYNKRRNYDSQNPLSVYSDISENDMPLLDLSVWNVVFADGPTIQVSANNRENATDIARRQLRSSSNFDTRRMSNGRILTVYKVR